MFEQYEDYETDKEKLLHNSISVSVIINKLKLTCVKQHQKSSADHSLSIPHLVRTPKSVIIIINTNTKYI
jgi:hypothetical protein